MVAAGRSHTGEEAMKLLVLATLLLSLAPAAAAPPDAPSEPGTLERLLAARPVVNGPLTLDDAVRTALRESPVVRGAVAEVDAAAARVQAARAERLPWVSANLFVSGSNNNSIVASPLPAQPQMIMGLPSGGFVDGNLMVMYPLFTSGRLGAMARQAAANRKASEADLEAQRQEIALMTRTAYREAQARRSLLEVWKAKLTEDQERLRVDREREKEGQIPAFYALRDESEVAATEQELTNATRDVELSLLQLRTVMGVGPASKPELTTPLDYQPSAGYFKELGLEGEPGDGTPLLRLAEQRRPELKAAAARRRSADAQLGGVRAGYGPQVSLFAMADALNRDPHAGGTIGAAASFPLFNGGQRKARLGEADAERRKQEQDEQRIALEVAQQVTAALLELRAAEQNVGTAQKALASAREDYRVARLRYESGRSTLVEALDPLATRTRAESNVVQALFQYRSAQDRLRRAVGSAGYSPPASSPRQQADPR
jgi:outer membrane protein